MDPIYRTDENGRTIVEVEAHSSVDLAGFINSLKPSIEIEIKEN